MLRCYDYRLFQVYGLIKCMQHMLINVLGAKCCSRNAVSLPAVPGVPVAPVLSDSQQKSLDKAALIVCGYREPQLRDCSHPQQGAMKLGGHQTGFTLQKYPSPQSLCSHFQRKFNHSRQLLLQ